MQVYRERHDGRTKERVTSCRARTGALVYLEILPPLHTAVHHSCEVCFTLIPLGISTVIEDVAMTSFLPALSQFDIERATQVRLAINPYSAF